MVRVVGTMLENCARELVDWRKNTDSASVADASWMRMQHLRALFGATSWPSRRMESSGSYVSVIHHDQ